MKRMAVILGLLFFIVAIPLGAFAGEVTITLTWDPNTETFLAGYTAYVSDTPGPPYETFGGTLKGINEIDFVYDAPDGQTVTKYFVVTAYSTHEPPMESGYSNEVFMVYDFSPIEAATEFAALLTGDDINFTWKQGDIARVKKWILYSKEAGAEFTELATIAYTGQEGPQYSTTETMTVPAGEIKTFTFGLVTFNERGVFSPNSNEVSITIDKRELAPVYNLKITVKAE